MNSFLASIRWQLVKRKLIRGKVAIIGYHYCYFLNQSGQVVGIAREQILSKAKPIKITQSQSVLASAKAEYLANATITINRNLFFLLMDGRIELS